MGKRLGWEMGKSRKVILFLKQKLLFRTVKNSQVFSGIYIPSPGSPPTAGRSKEGPVNMHFCSKLPLNSFLRLGSERECSDKLLSEFILKMSSVQSHCFGDLNLQCLLWGIGCFNQGVSSEASGGPLVSPLEPDVFPGS